MPSVRPTTIYPVAALIPTLPNTIIGISMIIARNLHQLNRHTRVLVICRKSQSYDICGTSRTDARVYSSQAVFAAGPSRQGEFAGRGVVGRLCYVAAVVEIVEPLSGI